MKKFIVSLFVVCLLLTEYSIASSSTFQIRNGQSCTKKQVGNLIRFKGKTFLCVATKYGRIWTAVKIPKQSGSPQSATTSSTTSVSPTTTVSLTTSLPGVSLPLPPWLANSLNPKYSRTVTMPAPSTTTTEGPLNASPTAGDLTGPVIVSASVVPNSVDVSEGPVSVTVTAAYVDASGMRVNLSWAGWSGGYLSGPLPRISGDSRNGVYQSVFVIPQGSRPGDGWFTINAQQDILGNMGRSMQLPFSVANRNWGVPSSGTTLPS